MASSDFLVQAVVYLGAAVVAVPLFKKLGLGAVLGYLLAGVIIGPYALQLIPDPEHVLHFAEFGVVLLLFLIGLELEPEKIWELRKLLFGLGGLQISLSILILALIGHALGYPWAISLVIAAGVAMSSTAIGLTSVEEKKQLSSPGGQASFAVLLLQDLSVIPLFILIALLAPERAGTSFNIWALLKAIAVMAAIVLASRTILRPIMRLVAQTEMREIFVAFALLLVISVALAVQSVGLSMALGTFLAGVLLADSEYRYELRLDVEPVKGLLLGLFFIAVGMSVDVSLVLSQPVPIIGTAILLVALKMAILFGLGSIFGLKLRDKLLFAMALSQVGEFAFVIYGIALQQGSIDAQLYNQLNAIVAISMLVTPLLFLLYEKFVGMQFNRKDHESINESNAVIIAGFGRFGQITGRILHARGINATLIDKDPSQVELMREFGWRCYYGDASRLDLLLEAGIAKARLLVIAINDTAATLEMAKLVKERWPHVEIVVRARSRTEAFDLRDIDLQPIRETFHSALEAARQSLIALGVPSVSAGRIVRQFENHDAKQLEITRKIRHDLAAVISASEEGRQDLKALLELEMQEDK